MSNPMWYYATESGGKEKYSAADARVLETAWQSFKFSVMLGHGKWKVDFEVMVGTGEQT